MKSPYRLLAVDLDGTLVRRDGAVDGRDKRALQRLASHGGTVTIATGRLYAATWPVASALGIDDGPLVCADGAAVVRFPTGSELSHTGITGEAAEALHGALTDRKAAVFALTDDRVVTDERGFRFERFVSGWSPRIERVGATLEHHCWQSARGLSAAVVIGTPTEIDLIEAELRPQDLLEVLRFDPPGGLVGSLLLHARGVSKGAGLKQVAEHYDCTMDEVVAIGDWLNDIPMFEAAGRSFAMARAPEAVAIRATDRLSEGGVADVIAALWPGAG